MIVAAAEAEQALVALAAVLAAALALWSGDPRRRAFAVLLGAVLAVAALATLEGDAAADAISRRPLVAAVGAALGLAVLVGLAALFARRPAAFALLAIAALPFRVPVPVGDDTASLLLPLYGVIGAGCLAYATRHLRRSGSKEEPATPGRAVRRLEVALAVVLVLYGAQTLYSTDVAQAVENVAFFYVPFALLLVLLARLDWDVALLRRIALLVVGMALVFAAVGLVEFATGRLLITNTKVVEANELKPYFRVNSLFFDPNMYGRFLAVAMLGLAAALFWARRARDAALIAVALAVLWGGLVVSLSQSSFAALLAGLALLAAVRWRARPVLAGVAVATAAAVAVVLLAPGTVGVESGSDRELNRATSGRVDLIRGGARMVGDRPLWGFGSGAYAERYRAREEVRDEDAAAVSHTIPLTVTAEQGVIGLAGYLFLLWAAFSLLLAGVPGAVRGAAPGLSAAARLALAAVFAAIVVHTWIYAAFLEDPMTWVLLAAGVGLHRAARVEERAPAAATSRRRAAGAPVPALDAP